MTANPASDEPANIALCPRCQTPLTSDEELACPSCGALIHSAELERLSAEARWQEQFNPSVAINLWQRCLALLPPSSRQYAVIENEIARLRQMPIQKLPVNEPGAATVVASGADGSTLDVAGGRIMAPGRMPVGKRVTAMVRPHRMRLTTDAQTPGAAMNRLDARVQKTVFAGEIIQYTVEAAGSNLMVDSHTSSAHGSRPLDAAAAVEWDVADTLVFEL